MTRQRGTRLTPDDVIQLRKLYWHHEVSIDELAARFQVSRAHTIGVVKHRIWDHPELRVRPSNIAVPDPIPPRTKLSKLDVKEIRRLYSQGKMTQRALARSYGCSQSHIANIVHERNWKVSKNALRMRKRRINPDDKRLKANRSPAFRSRSISSGPGQENTQGDSERAS
jgi:predicted DNA-binding protein (UPF0251 family)